ncbi:cell division protein FtsQ/DivIB [uncultured Dysosmobacter sp.]|uniref:cell division protein FtsQ/DivIB n=1 Tax=uncultured Dysosmobacter sp. TaxID=2591384 RepID=UPI0026204EB4|nr:FtsQ-type POTRA domain-containing protein [uncultured Dysosmobacter sp.]
MARRRHSNRRRRGSFGFLYKLLSTLVICGVIVAALTLFFRVDAIIVTGEEKYTAEEIIAATGVEQGDNLFLLNKWNVDNNIKKALPYVEDTRINKKLPDVLLVEIVKECRTPLAVVQDGSAWMVSARGMIVEQLPAARASAYGVIDSCKLLSPSVGTPIALATEYATQQSSLLALLAALDEAGMLDQVDGIHLDSLSVLSMDYAERFRVEMPYGADYALKLKALRLSLEDGKIQENMTGTFDLMQDETYFRPNMG